MEAKANRTSGSAKRSVVVTQSIPGSVCQWGGRVVGWKECFCSSVAAIIFPRLWDGKSGEPHRPFPQWCHTGQDNFPFSFIFVFFMRFFLRYFNSTMVHQFQAFLRSVNSSESGQYLWGNLNHLILFFIFHFKENCLRFCYSLYWFNSSSSPCIDLDRSTETVSLEFLSFQPTIKEKKNHTFELSIIYRKWFLGMASFITLCCLLCDCWHLINTQKYCGWMTQHKKVVNFHPLPPPPILIQTSKVLSWVFMLLHFSSHSVKRRWLFFFSLSHF